ncbi:MAG: cadmium-translocating P-type ATPase [Desulfovibrio sp.]|jgi:Cd2+/Zn2+-exporting ATPase|nr:cadmium-translocating P-type ATPase [Desulfovibrio sp.]
MEAAIKKEFILEGLYCPICADKIEKGVSVLDGVRVASVDCVNQCLSLEIVNRAEVNGIVTQVAHITREIEPDIRISLTRKSPGKEQSRVHRLSRFGHGIGATLFVAGVIFDPAWPANLAIFFSSWLLVGGEVVLRAVKNIAKGQVFDDNFLMGVATVGAFVIGEYPEGAAVMLFYQIGEAFQRHAVERSRKSISALMDIRPDFARLKTGDGSRRVSPEEVGVGDCIIVKPGEKIPLDGVVTEGCSALDTSALTGESLPKDVEPGIGVLSGSINKNGLLIIRVSKEFGESTVSRILDLTQNSGTRKARTENFITKFARFYTPTVVFAAFVLAVIPPLVLPGALFLDWLNRALIFLVVSCPCALVISIPLSFFSGIGGASRNGILVKGSNCLEALNNVDTVVFDKTGTLTRGVFSVTSVVPSGRSADELLYYAAHAESNSGHPIALSIRKAYGRKIFAERISNCEEIAGQGVRVLVDGKTVLVGNSGLLDAARIAHSRPDVPGTLVCLAIAGHFAGHIVISDELRPDSKQAVADLKAMGVRTVAMLTGDVRAVADNIGGKIGLDVVYAGLLPHEKVEKLEELEKNRSGKGKLIFVGDGINDAPALARADVGIAMGCLGSDAAIEAADVVLMTDAPSKIVEAMHIAGKTRSIVWQNIVFALGVKAVILGLGTFGMATMWEAVLGDVGVAVIAVLNSMRAMRVEPGKCSELT